MEYTFANQVKQQHEAFIQRFETVWQPISVYEYTLPAPYPVQQTLEALPLSAFPAGTTVTELPYELEPGAYLWRSGAWDAVVVYANRAKRTLTVTEVQIGAPLARALENGYLRPAAPAKETQP